jgi:hypothetical protein
MEPPGSPVSSPIKSPTSSVHQSPATSPIHDSRGSSPIIESAASSPERSVQSSPLCSVPSSPFVGGAVLPSPFQGSQSNDANSLEQHVAAKRQKLEIVETHQQLVNTNP